MVSGYEITIRGFIPVQADNPDSVIEVSKAVRALTKGGPMQEAPVIGAAFATIDQRTVKAKFVNKRAVVGCWGHNSASRASTGVAFPTPRT